MENDGKNNLADAMRRLIRFQRQVLTLKKCTSIDSSFDVMESLIIEVVDFTYASLRYRDPGGRFIPLRQICPDDLPVDASLLDWVMGTQEVSVLPADPLASGENLRSLVLMPLGEQHLMLLWMEQEAEAFTQEQEALLSVLSREMASVLDAHHFRLRLEKTRTAMADVFESVPIGLISLDHENLVQMVNSAAEAILGLDRASLVGFDFHASFSHELAGLVEQLSARLSESEGTLQDGELILADRQGGQAVQITVAHMRDDGGGKIGRIVVCRDLRLSREVEKLRELDAMKDDFLSLVTHELRTPLTSIMAYSETLLMDEREEVPADWREYIDVIHSEGKRLSRLIDDALDFTTMKAGKAQYNFGMQDPNEIVGAAVMALNKGAEDKNHTLELDLAENIGECRLADARFQQAVSILVDNAIKFTNPGGRIVVSTRLAEPLPGSETPSLLLTVRDSGIGIAQEH
ncbi:MAG: PAS domain S-box protein, partial [Planctomycetota bacterium]|nr:PAS domain S-box protein [Planctomycetota bacterium]